MKREIKVLEIFTSVGVIVMFLVVVVMVVDRHVFEIL